MCKVTGRCWKVNSNICVLEKVSFVGWDLANYPIMCDLWAGICGQHKTIWMCIVQEVTFWVITQCPGDPRALAVSQCCQERSWRLSAAVQGRTAEKRGFAHAPPKYGSVSMKSSGTLAAGHCCGEPCLWACCRRFSFPKPCPWGLHSMKVPETSG